MSEHELDAIGHALILSREYYLTEDMMHDLKVPFKEVTMSVGDALTLEPGTLYQIISTSRNCKYIRSLSRTAMWPHIGGPQAIIQHVTHMSVYDKLDGHVEEPLALFYWGDDSDDLRISRYSRMKRALVRQFPKHSIDRLLSTFTAPVQPLAARSDFVADYALASPVMLSHAAILCKLAASYIDDNDAHINNNLDRVAQVTHR